VAAEPLCDEFGIYFYRLIKPLCNSSYAVIGLPIFGHNLAHFYKKKSGHNILGGNFDKKNSSLKSSILHGQFEKQILHWVRFDILHANLEEEISSLCAI
jgi:hypothetical protein